MTQITEHFSWDELNPDGVPLTSIQTANLVRLAQLLESLRSALGVPLRITSGIRTPEHNAAVGGVSNSQHLTGSAADLVPIGISLTDAYSRFRAADDAGQLAPYSQILWYPLDGHIHIGLPTFTKLGEQLARNAQGVWIQAHQWYGFPAPRRRL